MKHIANNCDEWIVRNPVAKGRTSQPVYCISTHGVPQRTVTKRRLLRSRLEVTLKRQKRNERSLSQPVTENRLAGTVSIYQARRQHKHLSRNSFSVASPLLGSSFFFTEKSYSSSPVQFSVQCSLSALCCSSESVNQSLQQWLQCKVILPATCPIGNTLY